MPKSQRVDSTGRLNEVLRTCVGCRQSAQKTTLVRVIAIRSVSATVITPDRNATMPGRGAYVHLRPGCLEAAIRRRAFSRALRIEGPVDLNALDELLKPDGFDPRQSA